MKRRDQNLLYFQKNIIKILLNVLAVAFGVSLLSFFIAYLAPGDPAQRSLTAMGFAPTKELLEATKEKMGLNLPVILQYLKWLGNVLMGDLGTSYQYNQSVMIILLAKLPNTLLLTGVSLFLTIVIALPLGVFSALRKNGIFDRIIRFLTLGGISLPTFWVALVLMYFFCVRLDIFPVLSGTSASGIVLPAITTSLPMIGSYTRVVRTCVLEELGRDYVKGALTRGMKKGKVVFFEVLPNIVSPLLTLTGLSLGGLLGGSSIVESIYTWPGVGALVVTAIGQSDYPIIQGFVLWMALVYVVINMVIDIINMIISRRFSVNALVV